MASLIRVYVEDEAATGIVEHHDFNLADFGGQLPFPGDVIMPPLPSGSGELEVWEVLMRYFDPGRGFDARGSLHVVVKPRPLNPREKAALGAAA